MSLNISVEFRKRKINAGLSLLALLFIILSVLPLPASSESRARDSIRFFRMKREPVLANPDKLEISPEGTLAIWDRTLQRHFFLPTSNPPKQESQSLRTLNLSLRELLRRMHQGYTLKQWEVNNPIRGFFDHQGRFWYYDSRVASQADTIVLQSLYPDSRTARIPGPIRSIIPTNDRLTVQYQGEDRLLTRWKSLDSMVTDTVDYKLKGRLIGFTDQGRYLTRTDGILRSFEEGNTIHSRTFSSIKDVELNDGSIYVLTDRGTVIRLKSNLTTGYTFYLPRTRSYRSLAVREKTLYLTANEGLFKGSLDESNRSFFSRSTDLSLKQIVGTPPNFDQLGKSTPKIWLDSSDPTTSLLVKSQSGTVRSITHRDSGFSSVKLTTMRNLGTNPSQYFKDESTYQGEPGSLYYYFPKERRVEEYDTNSQLVRSKRFQFEAAPNVRDVAFVGAGDNRVIFSGEIPKSEHGFRRNLIIFDWSGNLKRIFTLQHPIQGGDYSSIGPEKWDISGGGTFYELHPNYIQLYDQYGFPRGTINEVYKPTDVARKGETLFVLDLNGRRLQSFQIPRVPTTRFALPPEKITVSTGASIGTKTVLTARSRKNQKLSLYEYNTNSLNYQKVLDHPDESLRYPTLSSNGDTVFFFGKKSSTSEWTLYRSDTIKYSARFLTTVKQVRGRSIFVDEKDLLLVPVEPDMDTGPAYHYMTPEGDTEVELANSRTVKFLSSGGSNGRYAITSRDKTYSIVSGRLNRDTGTAPLKWSVSDTLYQSSHPITRLVVESDYLYLVEQKQPGYSRLGRLPAKYATGSTSGLPMTEVRWLSEFRGEIQWITRNGRSLILWLNTRQNGGKLLKWYPKGEQGTGGFKGKLTVSGPAKLEGIPLRVEPGGLSTTTKQTGSFSLSDLPGGYLKLEIPSYKYRFAHPMYVTVQPGEYTVNTSIPLVQQKELLLLESGLKYFQRKSWNRSRISLKAFRELTEEGPYYEWADGLMEIINRELGDTLAQFKLFNRRPELFSSEEQLKLLDSLTKPTKRLTIYQRQKDLMEPTLQHFFQYRIEFLDRLIKNETVNADSLRSPLRSPAPTTVPHLTRKGKEKEDYPTEE